MPKKATNHTISRVVNFTAMLWPLIIVGGLALVGGSFDFVTHAFGNGALFITVAVLIISLTLIYHHNGILNYTFVPLCCFSVFAYGALTIIEFLKMTKQSILPIFDGFVIFCTVSSLVLYLVFGLWKHLVDTKVLTVTINESS